MTKHPTHPVTVNDKEVKCREDSSLLNALLNVGVVVPTACGGQGNCHLCRVKIKNPPTWLKPANEVEDRALGNVLVASGMRLSCQITVRGPLSVEIPATRVGRKKRKG